MVGSPFYKNFHHSRRANHDGRERHRKGKGSMRRFLGNSGNIQVYCLGGGGGGGGPSPRGPNVSRKRSKAENKKCSIVLYEAVGPKGPTHGRQNDHKGEKEEGIKDVRKKGGT